MTRDGTNIRRLDYIAAVILLLLGLQLVTGCRSEQQFYQDVASSRLMAFHQWQQQKQMEQQAQSVITGSLSLQDALKLALVNNKSLLEVLQEKEIARGGLVGANSAILPAAALTGQYTRLDEVSSFEIMGRTIQLGDVDNYSANLTVTQPVFAGGAIIARINAARLSRLRADQAVRGAVQNVLYEVARGYFDVLLSRHLYEISADAVRSAQASLETVQQKRNAGVASDFDVLRAQVELSNFRAELIKNRNTISISKIRLLKSMGVSQDSEVDISDQLAYEPWTVSMGQAVSLAYQNRPDLFERELGIRSQQEAMKIAQSRYWPVVNGFYSNLWSKPDPKNSMRIEWGRAWRTGVTAVLPLFDGFSREGAIIQEKARLRQTELSLIDTQENVLAELTGAILSIQDAAEFVESQKLNLKRAEEGLRLAEVGFKEGINTQVEVLDARAALTRARSLYYEAIHSHVVARLALQRAMGVLGNAGAVLSTHGLPQQTDEPPELTSPGKPEVHKQ